MQLDQHKKKIAEVIIGEDQPVTVTLVDLTTKLPFDLSTATEIEALLLKQDLTILHKKMTISSGITLISGPGGVFQINLTSAETTLLAPSPLDDFSDLEVKITIGGKLTIVQLPKTVKVLSRIFPSA